MSLEDTVRKQVVKRLKNLIGRGGSFVARKSTVVAIVMEVLDKVFGIDVVAELGNLAEDAYDWVVSGITGDDTSVLRDLDMASLVASATIFALRDASEAARQGREVPNFRVSPSPDYATILNGLPTTVPAGRGYYEFTSELARFWGVPVEMVRRRMTVKVMRHFH
jgi:hypothetical protein